MKKYKITLIGLALAISLYVVTIIFDLDLFEAVVQAMENLEAFEIDEFIIPLVLLGIFVIWDQSKRHNNQEIELEKLRIYTATMSSIHDIFNNLLNQLTLIRMTSEDNPGFNPEVEAMYQDIIEDASNRLKALSSVTAINENSILESVEAKSE